MKTEIYIATHKKFNLKKREGFIPIHSSRNSTFM